MKAVKMIETLKELNVLYTAVADQASKIQLDDYYKNIAMELALNIATKYEPPLGGEGPTGEEIQHLPDKPEWMKAVKDKIQRFVDYHMFELVERPVNKLVISTKWACRYKCDIINDIFKRKIKLVTRGLDYKETYVSIVKFAIY